MILENPILSAKAEVELSLEEAIELIQLLPETWDKEEAIKALLQAKHVKLKTFTLLFKINL